MSLEDDAARLEAEMKELGATPAQVTLLGCLSVAIFVKALALLATLLVMGWLLWACASACGQ
jgi:hypothetical protein